MPFRSLIPMLLIALCACSDSGRQQPGPSAGKPVVYTVNYPLQYFAERIGGDRIDVRFPAPAGEDPAYWEPDAATIQRYQRADLILLNGADYARWIAKATLPSSRRVDTATAFRDCLIELEALTTHSHGPEGEHAHEGLAFTTWLDPALAAAQAEAVASALAKLLPGDAAAIQQNLAALKADLGALDASMKSVVSGYEGAPLLGSHPVYQYLARAYRLNLEEVHWEPNEMPPAAEWRRLDTLLRSHNARWMIWEAPPSPEIAAELEKRGVKSAAFLTCGNVPDSGDYLSVMSENVERMRAVVE